jgi:hypothetical protein
MGNFALEEKKELFRRAFQILDDLFFQPYIQPKEIISILRFLIPYFDIIMKSGFADFYTGNPGELLLRAFSIIYKKTSLRDEILELISGNKSLKQYLLELLETTEGLDAEQKANILASCFVILHIKKIFQVHLTCKEEFNKSVEELIQEAKQGKKHAIHKLASLDMSFLYTDFCKEQILNAEFSGDHKFKERLGESLLSTRRKFRTGKRERVVLAAALLTGIDFPGSYESWYDFLVDEGIMHYKNPQAFERECRKYGLPKKYPKDRRKPY